MARYAKFFSVGGGGGGTNNLQLPVGTVLDTTLRQVQDGLGTGSPLYISTRRVGITSDSSVTTQTSSVIQATTTNANLVIAPNGTGALIASIPDGTPTGGGNARGQYAVDLKPGGRTAQTQVASGDYSAVIGGNVSTASGAYSLAGGSATASGTNAVALGGSCFASGSGSVAIGGEQGGGLGATASGRAAVAFGLANAATAEFSNSLGGLSNNATSAFSVVSGGQSNTASTGTHATVIGGQGNTSSGQYSISGGFSNTASGLNSIALGSNNIVTNSSVKIGFSNTGSNASAFAFGFSNSNTGTEDTYNFGLGNSCSHFTTMAIGFYNSVGRNNSIAIGTSNTVSGSSYSTILGGQSNLASGGIEDKYITIVGGLQCLGYQYGSINSASGRFSTTGDAQQSTLTARRQAALNSAATTVLSLDGTGTTNLIIPNGNNRLWAVKVVATAFVSVAGGTLVLGDSYMGEFTLLFKRVGGISSVVGVNSANLIYDTNMATAAFTFAAGASQDLQITFKAPTTASATTFRCVAKVELVEVAY
jgi:hypothetical protein